MWLGMEKLPVQIKMLLIIDKAWRQVSHRMMRSAWKKNWPALGVCEPVADSEQDARVVEDIVSLGQSMSLDVDEENVEELVKEHNTELTTEELQDLHKEQQVTEELPSEEEKNNEGSITTADIKELLGYWSKTQNIVEKWHPNVADVNRCINLFDDNVMQHFRKILKSRQWQMTLDRFFSKKNLMMVVVVVVVVVNHNLPLVDSRGDEKAHQKASFYGICLTIQAVISLHYTFYFYFG